MNPADKATAEIDVAYAGFEALLNEVKQYDGEDMSETDTRSKVIDPILAILGWKEPSIRREVYERKQGTYLDYKLTTTQPIFVVEAKKVFVRFTIPAGNSRYYRIGGAVKNDANMVSAIDQAREYAINSGILFCCVTNGFQFIFFRANNNIGVTWDHQFVFVFRDHQEVLKRFSEFYDCLSYESVSTGRFAEHIPINRLERKLASRFQGFSFELLIDYEVRHRNALFSYTREIIKLVFQGLDNEDASPELLEYCYVESARDSSYERGIGELLKEHRTKLPETSVKLYAGKKDAGAFQDRFTKVASRKNIGSVTLLLGTVGAGKTTFINRFRKVFLKDLIDSDFCWIQVSFNSFVEAQDDLGIWVNNAIKTSFKESYGDVNPFSWDSLQKIYESEIAELREGTLNPLFKHDKAQYEIRVAEEVQKIADFSETHVVRCLDFYAKKVGRSIVLIFDNADQHSPPLQNQAFLIAQKYSRLLKCMVFISLREESYWKNKEFGGLSAFHATAFQIAAPRIEQVLAKRFRYASLIILADVEISADGFLVSHLDLTAEKLDVIFRTLQASLLGEDRRFVRFLEYIAPGEVRRALDFVARFLTSGHTNINRIMDRSGSGNITPVSFHEFLQAVMLGDRVHYKEEFSDVINLFNVDGRGDQSHFNRIAVLGRVMSAVGESSTRGKGYVLVSDVIRGCESVGVTSETTILIIGFLIEKRLLALDTLIREKFEEESYVRATSAALYYVNELAFEFTYIDMVIIDTEVGDEATRHAMRDLSRSIYSENDRFTKLNLRIERARRFIAYLESEYKACNLAQAPDSFDPLSKTLIPRLVAGFEAQVSQIVVNAKKAFGIA